MSGKTDRPRPFSVTQEEFHQNFEAIDWGAREREAIRKSWGADAIAKAAEFGKGGFDLAVASGAVEIIKDTP